VIRALDGKDHICSGDGNDHVIAGRGGDSVQDESGSNVIELGLGPDFDTDGPGSSVHDGGPGRDFVLDLDGADTYHLGSGDDTWDGGPGQNSVFGETGNDFLRPWHNVATVMGIVDNIVGGSGNDLVDYPATSADTGRVRFRASRAFVTTSAGGKTRITGIESAFGGPQRDRLIGNTKTNFLGGSNGVDVLIGKAGSDHLDPAIGRSICGVISAGERMRGGRGNDWAEFACPPGIRVDLRRDAAAAAECGDFPTDGWARVVGVENGKTSKASCPDVLVGDAAPNSLIARGDDDTLVGGPGQDRLSAGPGDDRVDGGYGIDSADGGPGSDLCRNVERSARCERRRHFGDNRSPVMYEGRWPFASMPLAFPATPWLDPSIRV
jgi:Ca2+-binding RTX toxin-like protein